MAEYGGTNSSELMGHLRASPKDWTECERACLDSSNRDAYRFISASLVILREASVAASVSFVSMRREIKR
jgi:hypothetical protein